jgi:hypothetical protein
MEARNVQCYRTETFIVGRVRPGNTGNWLNEEVALGDTKVQGRNLHPTLRFNLTAWGTGRLFFPLHQNFKFYGVKYWVYVQLHSEIKFYIFIYLLHWKNHKLRRQIAAFFKYDEKPQPYENHTSEGPCNLQQSRYWPGQALRAPGVSDSQNFWIIGTWRW